MMESSDQRGQRPIPAQRMSSRPVTGHAQLLVDALEELLRTSHDPFAIAFKSLRDVLAFDQAMVLAQTDEIGRASCRERV